MLAFWIEADAFMRHMNRVLVGTMLEVAGGRRSVEDFVALLDGAPRARAGKTAPPHGLHLVGRRLRRAGGPAGRPADYHPRPMRVLLTNDDGIEAEGLQALRRALLELPGVELAVVAPDGNRSATARSITTRRPLWVERVDFDDGTHGFATDGTPVDCVRLAQLGLIEGFQPELVVSGINHGLNLGDDITYSGTVAAAFEALLLGPARDRRLAAVAARASWTSASAARSTSTLAAAFAARLVAELEAVPLAAGTLLNVNVPGGEPDGVEVTRLGKRIYEDVLRAAGRGAPEPPPVPHLRRRRADRRRGGHRHRRGRGGAHRGHAGPLRPDAPRRGSARWSGTTSRG